MNNRWLTKRTLIGILLLASSVAIAWWWWSETHEALQPTLKFMARACDRHASGPEAREELKPSSKVWINENTLLIQDHVSINCAYTIKSGKYKIDAMTLILEYETYNPDPRTAAACLCFHEVSYEITNLKKGDYEIKLLEARHLLRDLIRDLTGQ